MSQVKQRYFLMREIRSLRLKYRYINFQYSPLETQLQKALSLPSDEELKKLNCEKAIM
jgi:hypothetical protein